MEDGKFQICDINEKKLGLKKVVNINIIYLSNQRLAIDLTMSCEGKQNLENVTFKKYFGFEFEQSEILLFGIGKC